MRRGQQAGGDRAHRHVAVVAARVHASRHARGVGRAGLSEDRQRVHVHAQQHRRPAPSVVASSPVLADAAAQAQARAREVLGDARGGLALREGQLRLLVDLAAQAHQLRL